MNCWFIIFINALLTQNYNIIYDNIYIHIVIVVSDFYFSIEINDIAW